MSFSNQVKNEIARVIPNKLCCQKAELSSLLMAHGNITWEKNDSGQMLLTAIVGNVGIAKKIFQLSKAVYQLPCSVKILKKKYFYKDKVYQVNIFIKQEELDSLQEILKISNKGSIQQEVNWSLVSKNCCKRAYLRGVFLSRGFMNRPEGNYHLEIIIKDSKLAEGIQKLLGKFEVKAQLIERKKALVLYIKESDTIVDFLRIIGAHKALLDFENVRIIKSMRNKVNRQVNCETANLSKTVEASLRQSELIKKLAVTREWDNLSPQLKELAQARIDYPDYSLKELGTMLNPPLSKSGVAYRMRKLEYIVEKILKERI